jgi:hypothetical protein
MVATVDPLVFVSCSSTWSSGKDDVVVGAVPFTLRFVHGQGWRRSKANQVNGWKNDSLFIRASKASEALIARTGAMQAGSSLIRQGARGLMRRQ